MITRKKQYTERQKAIDDVFNHLNASKLWQYLQDGEHKVAGTLHRITDSSFVSEIMQKIHDSMPHSILSSPTTISSLTTSTLITTTGLFGHMLGNTQQVDHHLLEKATEPGALPVLQSRDGKYQWLDFHNVDYDALPDCEQWSALRIFGIQAVRVVAAEAALRFSPFHHTAARELVFPPFHPNTIGTIIAFDSDASFALQRLQGPNCKRLTFNGTEYVLDYTAISCFGLKPPLTFLDPVAKFHATTFAPVSININNGAFMATPSSSSSWKWRYAKLVVGCAEFNHHEIIDHFTYCHLVTEVFIMSTNYIWRGDKQNLIYRLLLPHFSRTLAVNNIAKELLVPWLKRHLSIFSDQGLDDCVAHHMKTFDCQKELHFEQNAIARLKKNLSEGYYYVQYGLRLWKILHAFVTDVLKNYIVPWQQVMQWSIYIRERLPLFPTFQCPDKELLIDMVCGIIFNASIQHSAVNDPQNYFFGFAPNAPCRLMKPVPSDVETKDWKDKQWKQYYFDSLPDTEVMNLQSDLVALLALAPPQNSDLIWCVMQDYAAFCPQDLVSHFVQELKDISTDMKAKNEYMWMNPDSLTRSVIR